MRSLCTGLAMCVVINCSFFAAAQQRDATAISFLNQAVTAAGGSSAISAIQDFTSQGTITHFWDDNPEQGQLTVKALGSGEFRIDSVLPEGTWSSIMANGVGELKLPDGTTQSLSPHNVVNMDDLTLPIVKVNAALLDQTQSIVDMGVVQFGSNQAREIGIQQNLRNDPSGVRSKLTRRYYFFDPSSLLLLRVQDITHPRDDMANGAGKATTDFANYQTVSGIQVPFSITEKVAGQQMWTMQLTSVAFNTGLSDVDFQF